MTVNAAHEPWNRRPRAMAHADRLAEAVGLDMAVAGWKPTVDSYLGRVTKARILEAVAEGRGAATAERIRHLKKGDMARAAEQLLAGSSWVPEVLRTPGRALPEPVEPTETVLADIAGDDSAQVHDDLGGEPTGSTDPVDDDLPTRGAEAAEHGATGSDLEPPRAIAAE